MKSILIVCFTDLKTDARVVRQINFLKTDYKVTASCFDAFTNGTFELFKIKKTKLTFLRKVVTSFFLLLRFNTIAYWILHDYKRYIQPLKEKKFDLIVANDVETLPFAFAVGAGKSKIFFDAHEYAPRQFEDRLYWRIFFQRFTIALCKKYIPKVHGMSNINNGIAKEYEKQFGVKSIIITNTSDFVPLNPAKRENYPIRLVHHGIFNLSRRPDLMIDLMRLLDDRFTLDLIYMLPQPISQKTKDYFEIFKQKALGTGKIKILPSLKSTTIIPFIHEHYDMGIILVPPVNFNYENGLPNKLFDCIQARLAMAVGPLREIANIVQTYSLGVVSPDFTPEGMASVLKNMSLKELNEYKQKAHYAASEMNASFNKALMLEAVKKLI